MLACMRSPGNPEFPNSALSPCSITLALAQSSKWISSRHANTGGGIWEPISTVLSTGLQHPCFDCIATSALWHISRGQELHQNASLMFWSCLTARSTGRSKSKGVRRSNDRNASSNPESRKNTDTYMTKWNVSQWHSHPFFVRSTSTKHAGTHDGYMKVLKYQIALFGSNTEMSWTELSWTFWKAFQHLSRRGAGICNLPHSRMLSAVFLNIDTPTDHTV